MLAKTGPRRPGIFGTNRGDVPQQKPEHGGDAEQDGVFPVFDGAIGAVVDGPTNRDGNFPEIFKTLIPFPTDFRATGSESGRQPFDGLRFRQA